MREGKIAVIGDKDLILAFKAISMEVFCADTKEEGEKLVRSLARNYSVIFITENLAEQMDSLLAKYKTKAYPAIIPIPSSGKSNGYGMRGIKADVERAIGTDILFNKED
ncbi:MAG: V-type ATP synthase subunit F [Clostridiales bacterium]|nr:V-type ATP synthase subunit F [Clostridiales bacterium]MBD5086126.1 V-type ATP synthase subunit F [Clostridiales bacterium]